MARITPPIGMSLLKFDIADYATDRFICTMRMPYATGTSVSPEALMAFIYSKRPTLRYRKIVIEEKRS